jgi:hypothetical protein
MNESLQSRIDKIQRIFIPKLHTFPGVSKDFYPWKCGLSPSAIYNCSLSCRKKMKKKTPETKWISIKRWSNIASNGIRLPEGIFISVKRQEGFIAYPEPHFTKKEYILVMYPYGNVWSQQEPGVPITEEWLFSDKDGILILEALLKKDAAFPIKDYFKSCCNYMIKNPDQVGIHLKRKGKRMDEIEIENRKIG